MIRNVKYNIEKWKPKKWKPLYEKIVLLSCNGMSNIMIARGLDMTPQHVSNILSLDQAEEIRIQYLKRMREEALNDIPAQLQKISALTTKRMVSLLESDEAFSSSPFAIIDRGLKVMEGTGHLLTKAAVQVNNNTNNDNRSLILSDKVADRLASGLEKANAARELHSIRPQIEGRNNGRDVGKLTVGSEDGSEVEGSGD